jgi:hypothetical protein
MAGRGRDCIHGHRYQGRWTAAYNSWRGMKQRCTNPRCQKYNCYGGRGITFDERWRSFEAFYGDMGDPPKDGLPYDLGRIDADGNYCFENCEWQPRDINRKNWRKK